MALVKVIYVDGETVITAENLNAIQDAIIALEESGGATVDSALSTTSENPVQNKVITLALQSKADSSAIPQSVVQYVSQSLTDAQKTQARDNIGAASIADLGTVFTIKGDVATVADLPASGNAVGDVYYVQSVSAAFVWLETTAHPTGYWEEFGEPIDLSGYIEKPSSASANQILTFNGSAWVAANKPTYTASDVGAITAPASPTVGDFLCWNGSAWAATTVLETPQWTEQTVSTAGAVTQALDPFVMYHFTGALTALTLTLNAPASGQIAHYHFDFNCGSTAPTVTIPSTVTMPDDSSFEASKHYEVDILNNYGAVMAW